jgi:hypothetical protein
MAARRKKGSVEAQTIIHIGEGMTALVEVEYVAGGTEIVTVQEARELLRQKMIVVPPNDGKALTKQNVYGENCGS